MKKVVAIVVTYNRCELLLECIQALKQSNISVDIIIVNNASTDDTEEKLDVLIKNNEIIYFNTKKNIGGAGGFNYGIKKAYELGYEYFWLMDDDTIVKENTLEVFLEFSQKHRYGFLSSLVLWTDGEVCAMNQHEVNNSLWNKDKKLLLEGALNIVRGTFVSFFTCRTVIEEMGLPIKEYFIWGDDTEYSLRISEKFPCYLLVNSQVIHKMKKNIGTGILEEVDDLNRIQRMEYSIRNDTCTYRRQGYRRFIKFSFSVFALLIRLIFKSKVYRWKKIKVVIKGYIRGLIFSPKIEYVTLK